MQHLTQTASQEGCVRTASAFDLLPRLGAVVLAGGLLAGCAYARPDPVSSPGLESGVIAGSGGGARALGNQVDMGVTSRTGPAVQPRPAR